LLGDALAAARHVLAARLSGADDWQARLCSCDALRRLAGLRAVLKHPGGDVTASSLSADGRMLACGSANGTISLWDVAAQRMSRRIDLPRQASELHGVWLDDAGHRLLVRASDVHLLFDLARPDAEPLRWPDFPNESASPPTPGFSAAALIPGGDALALLRRDSSQGPVSFAVCSATDGAERHRIALGLGSPAQILIDRAGKTAVVEWWSKPTAAAAAQGPGTPHWTWIDLAATRVIADGPCSGPLAAEMLHPEGTGLLVDHGKGKSEICLPDGARIPVAPDASAAASDADQVYIKQVAWSAGGKYVLAAEAQYRRLLVCDARTGKEIRRIPGEGVLTDASDSFVFGTGGDEQITVRSMADGRLLASFNDRIGRRANDTLWMPSLTVMPDGKTLLLSDSGDQVRLWDWSATGADHRTFTGPAGGEIGAAALSADGKSLVAAGTLRGPDRNAKTLAQVFDVAGGRRTAELHESEGFTITDAAFAPDGRAVLTASGLVTGAVRWWDAATGRAIDELSAEWDTGGVTRPLFQDAFAMGRQRLITANRAACAGCVWDLAKKAKLHPFKACEPGPDRSLRQLGMSPDEKHFFALEYNGTIHVFSIHDGHREATLASDDGPIEIAAFSPDAVCLLTVSDRGQLRAWDWPRQRIVAAPTTPSVNAARFSPDGRLLAAATSDGHVHVWDATALPAGSFAAAVELIPAPLATDQPDLGPPFDPSATGRVKTGMLDIQFGPPGEWLASLDEHGWLYVWDVAGRRAVLRRHAAVLHESRLVGSADGDRIAVVGSGADVDVFNLATGDLPSIAQMQSALGRLTGALNPN
jgi:WD40 repeat protein